MRFRQGWYIILNIVYCSGNSNLFFQESLFLIFHKSNYLIHITLSKLSIKNWHFIAGSHNISSGANNAYFKMNLVLTDSTLTWKGGRGSMVPFLASFVDNLRPVFLLIFHQLWLNKHMDCNLYFFQRGITGTKFPCTKLLHGCQLRTFHLTYVPL